METVESAKAAIKSNKRVANIVTLMTAFTAVFSRTADKAKHDIKWLLSFNKFRQKPNCESSVIKSPRCSLRCYMMHWKGNKPGLRRCLLWKLLFLGVFCIWFLGASNVSIDFPDKTSPNSGNNKAADVLILASLIKNLDNKSLRQKISKFSWKPLTLISENKSLFTEITCKLEKRAI